MPPSIALSRLPKEHAQAIKKRGSHRRLCCFPNSCCTNGTKRRPCPVTQNPAIAARRDCKSIKTVSAINMIDASEPALGGASLPARPDLGVAPCTSAQSPRLAISRSKHGGAPAAALAHWNPCSSSPCGRARIEVGGGAPAGAALGRGATLTMSPRRRARALGSGQRLALRQQHRSPRRNPSTDRLQHDRPR
jgi:hypothetical protein